MHKLSLLFVAVLSFAACKKGGGGADCAKALDHSMELASADMKSRGNDDAMLQKMKDLGLQHCKDDKWADDVLKCMVDAKTEAEGKACYGKLTPEQQDKMNKAAMEMMKPPAPPAAGSDTGSAGGGSAAAPQ
jgi:hypothetical protein